MTYVKRKCPFCKTPVTITPADRVDVQCTHCGKVWHVPAPATNVKTGWHYIDRKKQVGPVSWEKLQERARTHLLKPSDMIRQEGNKQWQKAGSVSGLFPSSPPMSGGRGGVKQRWVVGAAAAVLLAALVLIGTMSSRNRRTNPPSEIRNSQSPEVVLKTEPAGKPRDLNESAPKHTAPAESPAEKSLPPAQSEKPQAPSQVPTKPGFVPRTTPATPAAAADMKQKLRRYLFDRTGKSAVGTITPVKIPYVWSEVQYSREKNFRALYGLIGEHLRIADNNYLASPDRDTRQKGLCMSVAACRCATFKLKDKWLSIQICEAYIRPRLQDADADHTNYMGMQHILELMGDVYAEARDAEKFTEILELLVDNAHNRNTADGARARLAQMLDRLNRQEEAIKVLKDIDDHAGVAGAKRMIPNLEKKLQAKKQEKNP